MWTLKFTVQNKDSIYTLLTSKHKITDYFYPINYYKKNKRVFILGIHLLEGDSKEIENFAEELRKHKKTEQFERHDKILIVLMREEEKFYELLYDPALFHPSPTIIKEGNELWNIASWNRTLLENVMKELRKWKTKFPKFELHGLKTSDLAEFYHQKILPDLPDQQKKAFQFAISNGYYGYPRKITLEKLAEMMHISLSTYQEHLRKAEAKLLPVFSENVK